MGRFKRRFSDFSVKSKLAVLIYMFIAGTIVIGWTANFLLKTSQTIIVLVNEQRVYLEKFYEGIDRFNRYNLSGNPEDLQMAQANFKQAGDIAFTFAKMDSLMHSMPKEKWGPKFYEAFKEGANYDRKKTDMLGVQFSRFSKFSPSQIEQSQEIALNAAMLANRINKLLTDYSTGPTPEKAMAIRSLFSEKDDITNNFISKVYILIDHVTKLLGIAILLLAAVVIATGTFTALKISRSITGPINRLAENFKNIARGNIKTTVAIHTKNEIGEMSKAFSEIQGGLQNIIGYSKRIARGDFSQNLQPKSDNDELIISLNQMAARLEEVKKQNDKENWIQNGINKLDDQMRGNFTVRELSDRIINWLCHFLGAETGAVYVFDEVPQHLELSGSTGLKTEEVNKTMKPGENLIGKAALQKELQILHTKGKFLKVYSSTGELVPEWLYLLPMHTETQVQAVIELAAIHKFSEQKIDFLQLVAEKISVNLGAAVARFRHKELLDKTLEQAEELKARDKELKKEQEELKERHEELKAQEEELRVTNEELKSQEEELRVANEELAGQTKILSENEKNLQAQQEKLRKINNELKLASQYKSEFLANMSHELRTPLNSLLILSKLLSQNKQENLTEEQLKSVRIMHKSGKDLLELINEILDLSKIEAGKMSYNFGEVNTGEIKLEILHSFKPVAENKRLSFEVNQSYNFPEVIFSDKQRLMQIIKNLLSNAFKFTSRGGVKVKMGLTPESVHLHNPGLTPGNTFFIAVEDTGVGIPRAKTDDIFEAFQQADGSISRKYGGTGLGLSISERLTRVLGGEIQVESIEGKGSVFTVYLPLDNNLVGIGYKNLAEEKAAAYHKQETKYYKQNEVAIPENQNINGKLPVYIKDDRDSLSQQPTVLIIHNEKKKAQKLLRLCHKRNFNALAASGINDGINLATRYPTEAIIISDGLKDPGDLKKLRENKFTSSLPLHVVSRIDGSIFDEIEELTTPESENFYGISKNLEKNILQDFKQILVVEDDPVTREAIHQLFENKDIVLHEAKTGRQAYELISTKPFDCIILDLGLPDFSGNELLRRLKSNNVPIPNVIIHTARDLSGEELRELQKFSDSIVIKGLKSDERLMDEVTLFLHQVANKVPKSQLVALNISEKDTFKGKKVLVVDDDIRNVFATAQILEEREIEVLEAENGAVALEVLKNNPGIDLVLMDIMMPVMDGYEAMKIIRKTPETKDTPIITLSAKAMKEDYQKAIDNGANDYISKPVDVPKLLALLKIWLYK